MVPVVDKVVSRWKKTRVGCSVQVCPRRSPPASGSSSMVDGTGYSPTVRDCVESDPIPPPVCVTSKYKPVPVCGRHKYVFVM